MSPELAFNAADPKKPIPYKRVQAVVEKEGDFARPNPELGRGVAATARSTATTTARSPSKKRCTARSARVAIRDDVLYIADFSGLFHCLDAKATRTEPRSTGSTTCSPPRGARR